MMTKATTQATPSSPSKRLGRKRYGRELKRLQLDLVKLQESIRVRGDRVAVLVDGRDAAGKGGAIKRIAEALNPRICRIVALAPRRSASGPSGISSATSPSSRPRASSFCSTAVGTTAPASSA